MITLGIIGVVSALTIPSLMTNLKAIRFRSQFLKSYSIIQQAYKFMEEDDVSLDPSTYNLKLAPFYKTYMKYLVGAHDCGIFGAYGSNNNSGIPCYRYKGLSDDSEPYKSLDGKSLVSGQFFDDGQIALPNGVLLLFNHGGIAKHWITVDINGYNTPPNRWGIDLFTFQIIDGKIITMGDKDTEYYAQKDEYCNFKGSGALNGATCAQKAKENTDYFKEVIKFVK